MNEEILTAAAGTGETSPALRATSPEGEAKPARTLEMVTEEIRYLDAQAGRLVMGHALEIGRRLREAKDLVPYGEWGEYLEKQLGYTQTTANKLMKVFDEYGASQMGLFGPEVESETFTNLTYSKALALLSVPREEREQFAREVDAEHLSTRELQAAIRERDEARKALEDTKEELHETAEMLDKTLEERNARGVIIREHEESLAAMEKELAELKARPVDVAVQEPDPAEVEKRAQEIAAGEAEKFAAHEKQLKADAAAEKTALEEKLKKAKEKAKAEREKLEAKLKEAEAKISAAGSEDKAEAEKLRAETEQLKKQLAMSNQATVVFKLRFMAWQQAHQQMSEAFTALDEETKEKMRAAIRAQVKAWGWAE
ncbi:MAG: DUF3102 domain-containing protein [Oscillospiraceae bacterium]|nr:DUF3102 domain-containing protein [Oscillospiraceae bacterium]